MITWPNLVLPPINLWSYPMATYRNKESSFRAKKRITITAQQERINAILKDKNK